MARIAHSVRCSMVCAFTARRPARSRRRRRWCSPPSPTSPPPAHHRFTRDPPGARPISQSGVMAIVPRRTRRSRPASVASSSSTWNPAASSCPIERSTSAAISGRRQDDGVADRQLAQRPRQQQRTLCGRQACQRLQKLLEMWHAGCWLQHQRRVAVGQQRHRVHPCHAGTPPATRAPKAPAPAVRLVHAEGEPAHVEQQADVQARRGLQHAHLQAAAARRGRPVDQSLRSPGDSRVRWRCASGRRPGCWG